MPNMLVFRPADAVETFECWVIALTEPTCLPPWCSAGKRFPPCALSTRASI